MANFAQQSWNLRYLLFALKSFLQVQNLNLKNGWWLKSHSVEKKEADKKPEDSFSISWLMDHCGGVVVIVVVVVVVAEVVVIVVVVVAVVAVVVVCHQSLTDN